MKRIVLAIWVALIGVSPAVADLYIVDSKLGLGGLMVFDNNSATSFNGSIHGDYSIGFYSPSTDFFAQADQSVDIFQTTEYRLNASLAAGHTMENSKIGLFLGAISIENRNIVFQGGIVGMYELTPNLLLQGEAGVLTSGVDGALFQNNIPFYQAKLEYEIDDTHSIFTKVSKFGTGSFYHARGVIGLEQYLANSNWEFTFAAGAQDYNGRVFPVLRSEIKYSFGGGAPDSIRPVAGRMFDKFDPLEYLYYRSGRLIRQIAPTR